MAWSYDPSAWSDGVTIPTVADFQAIAADLHTRGGSVDGAGYGIANTGYLTLLPGAVPGTTYTVTGASWSGGFATLTIGTHVLKVNQRIVSGSITPSGYNGTFIITAVAATTISFALGANPGAYSSGGTVQAHGVSPALGMLAVDENFNLKVWNGSSFAASNGLADPGSNGIIKRTSANVTAPAVSGTDYAPATSGTAILKGNGAGGFSAASSGSDYAPATSGSAILKGNGSGGFANAVSATDYAPATSGSALLKGNGAGGFSAAVAGTDYTVGGQPNSLAYQAGSAQSIPNNSYTAISFDTNAYDVGSVHSTSVNPTRFTAPSTGLYILSCSIQIFPNATGQRVLLWKKNGATDLAYSIAPATASSGGNILPNTVVQQLTAGDYVEIFVYQDSGGALSLGNSLSTCAAGITKLY